MERKISEGIKDLVSIIIPTHNREDLICDTLESVRKQSYKDIEVIVVDDHSDDNTVNVIKNYFSKLGVINMHLLENEGRGACAARNTGIRASRGGYIQFFDDDDLMRVDHIKKKVDAIKNSGSDYVACNYAFFDNDTHECVGHKNISSVKHTCSSHLLTKSFPCPSFFLKREAMTSIGYWNEEVRKLQDMALFHRLFLQGKKGVFIEEELFDVRIHNRSMTSSSVTSISGYYERWDAYEFIRKEWADSGIKEKKDVLRALHFLMFTLGRNMYICGFKKEGIRLLLKIALSDICNSMAFVGYLLRYRTIHLTNYMANEGN